MLINIFVQSEDKKKKRKDNFWFPEKPRFPLNWMRYLTVGSSTFLCDQSWELWYCHICCEADQLYWIVQASQSPLYKHLWHHTQHSQLYFFQGSHTCKQGSVMRYLTQFAENQGTMVTLTWTSSSENTQHRGVNTTVRPSPPPCHPVMCSVQ